MEPWTLDLDGDGVGTINQLTAFEKGVEVEGWVQALGAVPKGASVTLIATEIEGLRPGLTASFTRTVEALPDVERPSDPPKFTVKLMPGKYTVYAVPPAGSGLGATRTTWDVGTAQVQAGRVIELAPEASVFGTAVDPMAAGALAGASVQAVAASSTALGVRDQVFGESLFVPRASTAVVDAHGAFELRADPGTFDLSVRPTVASGFAWLVRPSVAISAPGQDLGQLVLPFPIVYQGAVYQKTITSPGAENTEPTFFPNALIRAYVYLDDEHTFTDDPEGAAISVVQVAETRADDAGRFKLLVPPSLY
jgi:hypothetical protein